MRAILTPKKGASEYQMNHWIITGSNGYLGIELCRRLASHCQVLGFARKECDVFNLQDIGVQCHNYTEMPEVIKSGDIFVHCAGKTGNVGTWKEFESINVDWTAQLYSLAESKGAACFIFISSVAAVGYKNRSKQQTITESDSPEFCQAEFYGRSKWLAEQRLLELAKKTSTRLVILRSGLLYGRRHFEFSKGWTNRGWIVDPHQRVPLIYIDNFIDAVVDVVNEPSVTGVFFVVDQEQPHLKFLNKLKIKLGIMQYPPWTIGRLGFFLLYISKLAIGKLFGREYKRQPGFWRTDLRFHCRRSLYSTEALRKKTGWFPKITLIQGWKRTVSETQDIKPNQNAS